MDDMATDRETLGLASLLAFETAVPPLCRRLSSASAHDEGGAIVDAAAVEAGLHLLSRTRSPPSFVLLARRLP